MKELSGNSNKFLDEFNLLDWTKYYKWCKKHNKKCKDPRKTKSIHIVETDIRLSVSVSCECGKVKDMTKLES